MEKPKLFLGLILGVVLVILAVSVYTEITRQPDRDTAYQVSTIDALLQGALDGVETVAEIKKHGDFGIGTFDSLDGEMIVRDNIVYQAKADGQVSVAADTLTLPLATVTYFDRDLVLTPGTSMNYSTFISTMPDRLPTRNMVYAVQIHGTFPFMKVRAIPAQEENSTLSQAAQEQSVFNLTDTKGTVIGFFVPTFFSGLNVPGFHLHYLSDDLRSGGHILDFTLAADASVEYDITPEFDMVLPTSGPFTGIDLSQDLSKELAEAE
jgi:acetolactate decarboxylase